MGLAGEEEKLKRVKAMAERVLGLPGEAALKVLDYLLFYLYLFVLSSFFCYFLQQISFLPVGVKTVGSGGFVQIIGADLS